jgi:endoglycosylceramidase
MIVMRRHAFSVICIVLALACENRAQVTPSAQQPSLAPPAPLHVADGHFVDPSGRVVILRGINLSGSSKVPPFLPIRDPSDLDPLVPLGFNVVRLLFTWEAFEPSPETYDLAYLQAVQTAAVAAYERGMYVIVDIHQDGFSRHASKGAGDGFPLWTVSLRGNPSKPDNGPDCKNWPVKMFTDRTTHRSFRDFFDNRNGVRAHYMAMLAEVSTAFASNQGVIGYDLMNEPWGDEREDLAPLYIEAATVIRSRDPDALIFVEGHITTNAGLQTDLPALPIEGMAYAPHYYHPQTILIGRWNGLASAMNRAFRNMTRKSQEWEVPLFLGEFGMAAEIGRTDAYIDAIYDRMDAALASGAQWNYTPDWNEERKDGWNQEDFNIIHRRDGRIRPNFAPRPYPRATAGVPLALQYDGPTVADPATSLSYTWNHNPAVGATEVFLPEAVFPTSSRVRVEPSESTVRRDYARQLLLISRPTPGPTRLSVIVPTYPSSP